MDRSSEYYNDPDIYIITEKNEFGHQNRSCFNNILSLGR